MIRRAFAANLVPAVALWGFALAILLGYSIHPPTRAVLDSLALLKKQLGLGFSMPAQALASGLLPFLFQKLQSGSHRKTALVHVPYLMLYWALEGALVDLFYGLQAQLFGDNARIGTIVIKVIVDMGLFSPLLSMPLVVCAFAFKDAGFSFSKTRELLGRGWYKSRVIPVYIAALLVWTPAVAVLYALPLGVQFPFQATVACFWALILVIMTDKK
ncbi:hypothetical protein B1R32_11222 [Abditibacterium utsteinense]|uniref:Uncharacterized protein n=1 Tax=Abditibacterium utsteinense TaxID=1960156 RepID=A0A2S8SRF2_9BACT|nr:hypothetical protein [Abditibacterium utsteinense]PQV63367.1 hypothetical protein B1R32_11222 [Abditibacterium utsteinense]